MLRNALLALIVMVVAAPAFAVTWDVSGPCSQPITMSLTIPGYVQIIHQDCNITWDSNYPPNNLDFIRALAGGVRGQYLALGPTDKPAMDAWAQAYYESRDGALIYMNTNTNVTMTVTPGGNLTDGTHTLNTWYTLAAAPFVLGGVALNDGILPLDGPGSYAADDAAPVGFMELGGTAFWPNQYPFAMAGGQEVLSIPAPANGTLKWLGRVERNGLNDVAGAYAATITVGFTAP
jgi:hypothetical protein